MKVLVYYHDDMDGVTSAAIVGQEYKTDEIEYIPCQYDEDILIKLDSDMCFILDFSFSQGIMDILFDYYKQNLIWIDHHVSAIAKLTGFDLVLGIRDIGQSGCLLTWEWFNITNNINRKNSPTKPSMAVEYADDYDRWVFKWGDESRAWAEMFSVNKFKPTDPIWTNLLDEFDTEYRKLVDEGFILLKAKDRRVYNAFNNGLDITFHGYKTRAMNMNFSDFSQAGDYACKDKGYELGLCYSIKGKTVIIGLRSCGELDVSKLAELYKGGGHKNASGARIDLDGFMDILK